MQGYDLNARRVLALATGSLILLALSGCVMAGPKAVSMGRAQYNEAINKTESEQMLLSIVKGRYGESFLSDTLLAVSGVAANVRFSTSAGIQAGFGPQDNYTGNLVPFIGGLTYEENPTITYAPVQGERYLRQLLSPVPLDILILMVRNETYPASPFTLLANRVNDMRNPEFLDAPFVAPDNEFHRFVELSEELHRAGVLRLVANPGKDAPFIFFINGYAPTYTDKVSKFLMLLGFPMPKDKSEDIVIPIYFAVKRANLDGVAISTRSTYDLIQVLRAAIEVPQEHTAEGLTVNYPVLGMVGKNIHIHVSKNEPKRVAVAVNYRGYWFYIDDTDLNTKFFFRMLQTLWSISIAASADQKAAPVLTIPVSR
jgi:hypothetical protein